MTTEVIDETADLTVVSEVTKSEKKNRVQLAHILKLTIPPARCQSHLKQHLGDDAIEAEIDELKKQIKEPEAKYKELKQELDTVVEQLKTGSTDELEKRKLELEATVKTHKEVYDTLKAAITHKLSNIVRISNQTSVAIAALWDSALKELIIHGLSQASLKQKRMVEVSHLHEGNHSDLVYFPIYDKCDTWSKYDAADKENTESEDAAAQVEVSDHAKTTFCTYVGNSLGEIRDMPEYAMYRFSGKMKDYLSKLIADGIKRLAVLTESFVRNSAKVRTMNPEHIKTIVRFWLEDSKKSKEQVNHVFELIDEKLKLHNDHNNAAPKDRVQVVQPEVKKEEKPKKEKAPKKPQEEKAADAPKKEKKEKKAKAAKTEAK